MILTLNLWGTNGPTEERMATLGVFLREQRPDVLVLQEVEDWKGATQARHLADAVGYSTVCAVRAGRGLRHGEGLAVLTDGDTRPVDTVALPGGVFHQPRGVQLVDVACSGGVVRIANTHLTWQLDDTALRVEQATAIRDELAGWTGPAVIAGDLNDVAGSAPLRVLTDAGFVDALALVGAPNRPTFDLANPYLWQPELAGRRVDHLLVRGLAVTDARVLLTGDDGPIVSDHFGVRATLAWPQATGR